MSVCLFNCFLNGYYILIMAPRYKHFLFVKNYGVNIINYKVSTAWPMANLEYVVVVALGVDLYRGYMMVNTRTTVDQVSSWFDDPDLVIKPLMDKKPSSAINEFKQFAEFYEFGIHESQLTIKDWVDIYNNVLGGNEAYPRHILKRYRVDNGIVENVKRVKIEKD